MRRLALALVALVVASAASDARAAESLLDKVKQKGEMIVGTKYDFPPMGSINKDTGQVEGFEVDLANEIGKELGVKVKFVQALSKTRIPLIVNGNVDLIVATMTHKREREQAIDFTMHYMITGQRPVTRKDTGITHVSQLAGKQVDAVVSDDVLNQWWVKNNPDLVLVGKLYTIEPYGMGVRQNDSRWRNAINQALMEIWDSGRYHEIHFKWFGQKPEFEIPWY